LHKFLLGSYNFQRLYIKISIEQQTSRFMCDTDTNPNPETLQRLPASLSESLDALNKDDFLKEFMSDKLLTTIKAIRKVCIWFRCF